MTALVEGGGGQGTLPGRTAQLIDNLRRRRGRTLVGVSGSFTAAHRCAEPELHVHRWDVLAWFETPGRVDARCYQASLDILMGQWEGKPLPLELEWQEDLARAIGSLINCVEVQVSRPAEGIYARWQA